MAIIETLQDEIKNSNSSIEELQKIFHNTAETIMNEYILNIKDMEIELTEIEFYYFDCKKHSDTYVHLNKLQKNSNSLYVHQKWGNYGGIDLTFGDDNSYGGILIRGIKQNDKFICGPAKVRVKINEQFNEEDYTQLQKKLDDNINLVKESNNDETILRSTRIGLSDKDEDFKFALYRFVREDYFEARNDKNNIKFEGNLKETTKLKCLTNDYKLDYKYEEDERKKYKQDKRYIGV
jgi:hypothetical protein